MWCSGRRTLTGRTGVRAAGLAAVLGSPACSTVSDDSGFRCASDDDCPGDQVCLVNLGAVCVPSEQAPARQHLGLEVCEDAQGVTRCDFKSEILGCDVEVGRARDAFTIQRPPIGDEIELAVFALSRDDPSLKEVPEAARITALQEISRIARPLTGSTVDFTVPEDPQGEIDYARLRWPYHHPRSLPEEDRDMFRAIVAEILPTEAPDRAPFYRMLLRRITTATPASCQSNDDCGDQLCVRATSRVERCTAPPTTPTGSAFRFNVSSSIECHRKVIGQVQRVATDGITSPISDVQVGIRYSATPTVPILVPPLASEGQRILCRADGSCAPGLACLDGECVLDMAGRTAGTVGTTDENGQFESLVYTYCDGGDDDIDPELTLVATPGGEAASTLPRMTYDIVQPFYAETVTLPQGDALCFPNWGQQRDIQIGIRGEPAPLWSGPGGTWTCCDTSCLPAGPDASPPEAPAQCNGTTGPETGLQSPTLKLATQLLEEEVADWEGCQPPRIVDGVAGELAIETQSCDVREPDPDPDVTADYCTVTLTAGLKDRPQPYQVRIETPPNSVLASTILEAPLSVTENTSLVGPIRLEPRPIISGRVLLPEDRCRGDAETCGAEGVEVVAERVAVASDDPGKVVGPFLYRTETFADPSDGTTGHFALPVNPGRYLLTALPSVALVASPSPISVVDATDDRPDTELQLSTGSLVRIRMKDFDRSASVYPVDIGTWGQACAELDLNPGCLNASDTCYGTPGVEGCRIRAMVSEQRLLLGANGEVQFIARPARDNCP